MSGMITMKNRLSVGRFVNGYLCGKLGHAQMQGLTTPPNPAMTRGTRIHEEVEKYANGFNANINTGLLPPVEDIMYSEDPRELKIDGMPVPLYGIADLVTHDTVYEVKTGNKHDHHHLQVASYKLLYGVPHGKLIYLDKGEIVDVEQEIKENDILLAWSNIMSEKVIEKSSACKFCQLKKSCHLFVQKTEDPILNQLLHVRKEKKELKEKLDPMKDKLSELNKIEDQLMIIVKGLEPKTYNLDGGSVKLIKRKSTELPQDFMEQLPYEQNKHLYNYPKPKINEMKKQIGIEKETISVTVKLEEK